MVLTSGNVLSGAGITFEQTVDSDILTPRALTIYDSGTTTFMGQVGGTNALASFGSGRCRREATAPRQP